MKTDKEDFPFRASDCVPQLFQRMFQDCCSPENDSESHLGILCDESWTRAIRLQKTIDDILSSQDTCYTIHFDETTTSQIKKQLDVLVRHYSYTHYEV